MRKTPRQARSRQMVERIVEGARQVLATDGYDVFSTNRVAAAAGVSPGSLYQYFPDKSAILDLVVDRYWDDVSAKVAASLADRATGFRDSTIRDVADALISALQSDVVLLRVVAEDLPVAQSRERRAALEQRVRELLALALRADPRLGRRPDPGTAAWVVVLTLETLTLRWVLDDPPLERGMLLDEIDALVRGYLGLPAPTAGPR